MQPGSGAAPGAEFMYIVPNFQNPGRRDTCQRSPARATARPSLEEERQRIVEDDPYGQLRYDRASRFRRCPRLTATTRGNDTATAGERHFTSVRFPKCWRRVLRRGLDRRSARCHRQAGAGETEHRPSHQLPSRRLLLTKSRATGSMEEHVEAGFAPPIKNAVTRCYRVAAGFLP